MNNKKAYKHKMKKENRPGLRKFFERYEHEDENLKKNVQDLSNEKFNPLDKPNDYNGSFGHDFMSIMWATLLIDILKNLRKEVSSSASDLDLKLGFTKGYPMASIVNTQTKPTKKNVKILSKIFDRMHILFPEETKRARERESLDKYIDVNEILQRTLLLHGFNESANALKNYENEIDSELESDEQTETDNRIMSNIYELVISDTIIQFNEDDTVLSVLKKIKEQTNLKFEVFETLKEKVI